jgi:uncharacterized protein (TIGR03437 family)
VSGKYITSLLSMLLAAAGVPATAQTWDTSGNGQLNGSYYFREVAWQGQADATNDLNFAAAVYGTIVFDGNGHYTLQGAMEYDFNTFSNGQGPLAYSLPQPGTYSLAASGYGFLSSFLTNNDTLNLLVSNGVIVGSSTDNAGGYNDLFIAAPVSSNSNLSGNYSVVGLDSPPLVQGSVPYTRAYSLSMTADGNGGIGSVQPTGYFAASSNLVRQGSISGIRYHMSGGAAVVQFAGELNSGNVTANLMSGQKYFYFSPDGNFIFGGSPTGWDMIVGVRQNSGAAANFSGLYYTAGFTQDDSTASAGYVNLNSGYGSLNALSNGLILAHQRLLSVTPSGGGPFDYTYSDVASPVTNGLADSFTQYAFGGGGAFGIGFAKQPGLGIEVLVQGPPLSGQGVYVNPTGVVNAGSLSPFTASWAPGELVSIFGTNLSSKTDTNGSLPTTLDGVQVLVNGTPAPIYFVSPGQINAVIPFGITTPTASIQVSNASGQSNTVINYIGQTAPGVFNSVTLPAIQHSDYTMVTPTSPAQIGETLLVYLTGLGAVDSSGNATAKFTASIGGQAATVGFAGTQSTVGGGYQLNVAVPTGVTAGNVYLDISGPDTYNSEVVLPIGTASGATIAPQAAQRSPMRRIAPQSHRRPSIAHLSQN